jgi:hypothetical protein
MGIAPIPRHRSGATGVGRIIIAIVVAAVIGSGRQHSPEQSKANTKTYRGANSPTAAVTPMMPVTIPTMPVTAVPVTTTAVPASASAMPARTRAMPARAVRIAAPTMPTTAVSANCTAMPTATAPMSAVSK